MPSTIIKAIGSGLPRVQSGLRHPRFADRTVAPRSVAGGRIHLDHQRANVSALLCLPEHAPLVAKAARDLPPNFTVDPLDLSAQEGPMMTDGKTSPRRDALFAGVVIGAVLPR
jgi:hypothetical protein